MHLLNYVKSEYHLYIIEYRWMKFLLMLLLLCSIAVYADNLDSLLQEYQKKSELSITTKNESAEYYYSIHVTI